MTSCVFVREPKTELESQLESKQCSLTEFIG